MRLFNGLVAVWFFVCVNSYTITDESLQYNSEHNNEYNCSPKDFGHGSPVCVCNDLHCDKLRIVTSPPKGQVLVVTSTKDGQRWQTDIQSTYNNELLGEPDLTLTLDTSKQYQKIYGFGGAFTDATGINLGQLSRPLQDAVISGYYGAEGLEYNLGRVPIAGTDFSTHPYSYLDLPPGQTDPSLQHFQLAEEDDLYKIPYIKQAVEISFSRGKELKLFSSPWSAPGWMKTNGQINGQGKLIKKYYANWASYIVKFFNEYKKRGVTFVGLTAQNEPTAGLYGDYPFNAMGWLPEEQGDWIANHLGPQLGKQGHNLTIFIGDDNRFLVPQWARRVMSVKGTEKYVGGIAVHWYTDQIAPLRLLDIAHHAFPALPILYTEACAGAMPWDLAKVILGSWERAEQYAQDIIENLNHWVVGWTDWNLALDQEGGPNWVQNFVDSPIIVNADDAEFYRQPMFYAIAHFSKVIPEGSTRVRHILKASPDASAYVEVLSFIRKDGSNAVIVINRADKPFVGQISENKMSFRVLIEARSIKSLVWQG